MKTNEEILEEMIAEWIYHTNKLKEINQFLFNKTELYEGKYQSDFNNELFRFFAGKITRFSKDINQLNALLTQKQLENIYRLKILKRN